MHETELRKAWCYCWEPGPEGLTAQWVAGVGWRTDHWKEVEILRSLSGELIIYMATEVSKMCGRNSIGENDC